MAEQQGGSSGGAEKLGAFAEKIAELVAEKIGARLADHAARGNGMLAPHDVQGVLDEVSIKGDKSVHSLCESTWAGLQHQFEEAFYARMRKFPLERLVVARFVHLLPERGEDPVPNKTLSRRIIPAFTQAMHQMVGPELFEEYENRAREMVENISAREGDSMDWDRLHERPVARILVNDILIYISRYFLDCAKRRDWMISFFDRTMPAAKSEAEKAWHFGDMEFHKLMSALYRELAEALYDVESRQRLEQRYDAASLSQLEQMLAGLAQDQKRVLAAL
ncbi:MAG: hypothetical protein RIM33_01210 [Alphaproteobacteria bacterium]